MSGIKEIKEKAKLSIDEMFDNQSVGKVENHFNGNPTNQPSIQPPNHPNNQLDYNPTSETAFHSTKSKQPTSKPTSQLNTKPENQLNVKVENQQETKVPEFAMKPQQSYKPASYKMTFNLTEDAYKAFNDLYAKRMLQGKKTEKSDLICEAIQWLIQMEEQNR